ncbi:Nephrocystin-3 [Homo sapiens] [Rhizoctonia solani]|uniref:Nephrocystin-3 [Homo sapiens] n=1 Tax=Rhizoctonia solani TaxID=456999 RepID=A0A0K6G8D1_9AGAM|nr:Nephrocystin-3 [Homo sapiens] [Rhizoctonia solani]
MVFAMGKHNLNAALPVIFRSYPATANPGPNCAIWEALRATTAHPDLFKSIDIVESSVIQSFVGGEIGCSNPLVHVLIEVERVWPGHQVARVISIGTGHARTIQVTNTSRWYHAQDVMVMKDMATDSERVAQEMLVRFQMTSQVYFRFNVDQGLQDMKKGSWERLGEAMQHTKAYLQKHETDQKLNEAVRSSMERRGIVSTAHGAGQIFSAPENGIGFKHCPAPTKTYTGRVAENAQVIKCITLGKKERRVCVIYGLGGVGKTQLVLSVIEQTWNEWDYIIYVDASSTESIEKALAQFGKARNIGETWKNVVAWLESCTERWLVVFDNADTPTTNVRQYVPARGRCGSVLITTRLPNLARLAEGPDSVCHLSSMSRTDGTELLVKMVGLGNDRLPDDEMTAAEELVQNLGGLALAIVHAGAYIAYSAGMTITRYQDLFLSQRRRMLEQYNELPVTAKLEERGDTVYTTWRISFDQLKPESRELLGLIAYLHHTGISEDIFKRAAAAMHLKTYPLPLTDVESQAQSYVKRYLSNFLNADGSWDAVSFIRVMSDLTSFSLVDFDRINLTYRVHVLVHDWAKSMADPALAVEYTATLLSLSIDHEDDTTSLAFKNQLGLHVTSALTHNHNIGANHGYYFEQVYNCTGQWEQQIKLLQQLLEASNNVLGEYHSDTLGSMTKLAWAHQRLGQYDKAEQLEVEVLDACKQAIGVDHSTTLDVMSDLAWIYSCQGQYDKSKQLGLQVIDHYKRVLGAEHPDTLTSMSNLAWVYSCLGQYDKAEQLGTQVIIARKRILGAKHPSTLDTMSNLASTYLGMGQYDKAEQLGLQIIDLRKRLVGAEHPDTLIAMGNLAWVYSCQGQYDKAEQLGTQVISTRKRILGAEHPHTLNIMGILASTYLGMCHYDKAEQLGIETLDAFKRVLGVDHPDTLFPMSTLASTYLKLGQYDKAERLGAQVVDTGKRVLGDEHPDTLNSISDLASTYLHMGKHDEANKLLIRGLDACKRVLGDEHPTTLKSMHNLALVYSDLGRWDEADELCRKALNIAERTLGDQHPSTRQYRTSISHIHNERQVKEVITSGVFL